jgi:hypothetical protein
MTLDDLSAWVSAMMAGDPASVEQAIERWRQQQSLHCWSPHCGTCPPRIPRQRIVERGGRRRA